MTSSKSRLLLPLLGTLVVQSIHAAPDAGQILRDQLQTKPGSVKLPEAEMQQDKPALEAPAESKTTVMVKRFRFTGHDGVATESELQAQVKSLVGKKASFADLQQAALQVTQYLRNKGWVLSRAYLPKQDITDGVIEIAIIRGKIGKHPDNTRFQVSAPNASLKHRAEKTLDTAMSKKTDFNQRDLERGLLLLNDLPATQATASLSAGASPKESLLSIDVKTGRRIAASTWLDNYGNYYTGTGRVHGKASLNNTLLTGDLVSGMATWTEGLVLGRFGYQMPLGYRGLRADIGYTTLHYEIGQELTHLDSKGSAHTADAQLTYPIIRSRQGNLWISGGLTQKALKDETLAVELHNKRLTNWQGTLQGDAYDTMGGGGLTNASLSVTQGKLDLSRVATDLSNDASNGKTNGTFTKFNYSLARLQSITTSWSFFLGLNGQMSNKNLDSSEKITLGGPSAVRAYPVGEASGDSGWIANAELRYDFPRQYWGSQLQAIAFFDNGQVTLNHSPWGAIANMTGRNSYSLRGTGLGLNLTKPDRFELRTAWAMVIGDNAGRNLYDQDADGHTHGQRVWLQGLLKF